MMPGPGAAIAGFAIFAPLAKRADAGGVGGHSTARLAEAWCVLDDLRLTPGRRQITGPGAMDGSTAPGLPMTAPCRAMS